MNETLFTAIWVTSMVFGTFSGLLFTIAKKPEYTLNRLFQYSWGYWYKNLDQVVPERWVKPIYSTAFAGAFLMMADVLYLLISAIF